MDMYVIITTCTMHSYVQIKCIHYIMHMFTNAYELLQRPRTIRAAARPHDTYVMRDNADLILTNTTHRPISVHAQWRGNALPARSSDWRANYAAN